MASVPPDLKDTMRQHGGQLSVKFRHGEWWLLYTWKDPITREEKALMVGGPSLNLQLANMEALVKDHLTVR